MKFTPIAIVGKSCIVPGSFEPNHFWEGLLKNKVFLSEADENVWGFDPKKILSERKTLDHSPHSMGGHIRGFKDIFQASDYNIRESFVQKLDELFQWTLFCGHRALENVSWKRSQKKAGVVLGSLTYPTKTLNDLAHAHYIKTNHKGIEWHNRFIGGLPAQVLSHSLGLTGPTYCIDAACASSLYAIQQACELLRSREIDLAISGGINAIESSFLHLGFSSLKALSSTAQLQVFSKHSNGLVPARGAAFVALRRLEDAVAFREPILGVIRGIGLSNDGKTGSLLSPSSPSQIEAIRKAYDSCDIEPEDVSYMETHATGTLLGDACELASMREVFHDTTKDLYLGSLKVNTGHLLAASGAAALIKVLHAFQDKMIPPFLPIQDPIPELINSHFRTPENPCPWTSHRKIAAINAFGFGGNNAHLIVEEYRNSQKKFYMSLVQSPKEKIAIVGIGIRLGSLHGKEKFLEKIQNEDSQYSHKIEDFSVDISKIHMPPKDLEGVLPQQLLLLPTIEEALSDLESTPSEKTGIIVGTSTDAESSRYKLRVDLLLEKKCVDDTVLPPLNSTRTLGCMPNVPANRLNLIKNWKAPSYALFGEEFSGIYALKNAKRSLENHEADCMIVSCVDLSCEPIHEQATKHCKNMKASELADGAICFILKRLNDAQMAEDPIYGILEDGLAYLEPKNPMLKDSHSCVALFDIASKLLDPRLKVRTKFTIETESFFKRKERISMEKTANYTFKNPQEPKLAQSVKAHLPPLKIKDSIHYMPTPPKLPKILDIKTLKKALFDKKDIEEHASGHLSKIFGDRFKSIDSYKLRVRMPEAPMLLTDRVLALEAEPASMKTGWIMTETDVVENSWYLHEGRMLPGPAIEAGQSDLFLVSYLGVDFENQGKRSYRLLGCDATYFRDLPKAGETLRYKIYIDRHMKLGKSRLFFFHYDCWIGDELFLQIRNGQAGFFSYEELKQSGGVLWSPKDTDFPKLQHPIKNPKTEFSGEDIDLLTQGDAFECFGKGYEKLASHRRTPNIPFGQNLLLEKVVELDPNGGAYKNGYIRIQRHISPEDWFFKGHFKNDPCMPGTLMTEMALQGLSFLVVALGYTLDADYHRFIPSLKKTCKLTCRGQALPESKLLDLEIHLKTVEKKAPLQATADILLSVDDLKALLGEDLNVQLQPDWIEEKTKISTKSESSQFEGIVCNEQQILNTSYGKPSSAFGKAFEKFDTGIRMARLPAYPYIFLSRIKSLDAEYCGLKEGSTILSEWDIPKEHPLFSDPESIPFSVLLEALLQPCGWLGSYVGCPLESQSEIFFRNLEGEWKYNKNFYLSHKLRTSVTLSSLVKLKDTIITEFDVRAFSDMSSPIVELKTRFGYFTKEALTHQKGMEISEEEKCLLERNSKFKLVKDYKTTDKSIAKIFPHYFKLLDTIEIYENAKKSFYVLAEKEISPKDWFFKAHFFQDPVMPGSLGLEAMMQALEVFKLYSIKEKNLNNVAFSMLDFEKLFSWKYRGQVLSHNKKMRVFLKIEEDRKDYTIASASLFADEIKIYEAKNLSLSLS